LHSDKPSRAEWLSFLGRDWIWSRGNSLKRGNISFNHEENEKLTEALTYLISLSRLMEYANSHDESIPASLLYGQKVAHNVHKGR
jgi:hypothetical protein